ncbi:MAG: NAD(P)H-dependent oxidoreductase [Candidatus Metalachnospira sp.]|nr:NAD(P)H-dependent oxidoreductase [Candidatus Metalachnospira sp.]
MEKVLFVNCCIRRGSSRTYEIAKHFVDSLDKTKYEVEELCLMDESMEYFKDGFFEQRERLINSGNFIHPRFRYAWQFKNAGKIVIAAPFWDLSFPALLKVYFENLCVEGITFDCNETGCFGTCKADKLVYITSRGGIYNDSPMEMGARYIEAMCGFFGIESFKCIAADGLDVLVGEYDRIMADAKAEAEKEAVNF